MKYNQVPNIITGKDLDYLSDMFNWNYAALKSNLNSIKEINDLEIKEMIENSLDLFKNIISEILSILANGGTNE